MKQQSPAPTRKVAAAGGGGAALGMPSAVILIYVVEQLTGQPLPSDVAAAVGAVVAALVGFAVAYAVAPSAQDRVVADTEPG